MFSALNIPSIDLIERARSFPFILQKKDTDIVIRSGGHGERTVQIWDLNLPILASRFISFLEHCL
jgi:hypothetical protein